MFLFQRKAVEWDSRIELRLSRRDETDVDNGIRFSAVFDIYLRNTRTRVGYISFRYGEGPLLYYLGHVGYRIEEEYRGNGYAFSACLLLKRYLNAQGITTAVITTNEDSVPSRKTCEKLKCILERVAPVPHAYRDACQGALTKCRYIWFIKDQDESNSQSM